MTALPQQTEVQGLITYDAVMAGLHLVKPVERIQGRGSPRADTLIYILRFYMEDKSFNPVPAQSYSQIMSDRQKSTQGIADLALLPR